MDVVTVTVSCRNLPDMDEEHLAEKTSPMVSMFVMNYEGRYELFGHTESKSQSPDVDFQKEFVLQVPPESDTDMV
jgi:hypothetical protein